VRIVAFILLASCAIAAARWALRLGFESAATGPFRGIAVFLAGALIGGVLTVSAAVICGIPGDFGLVAFAIVLVVDVRMLMNFEREGKAGPAI
jgi:hypothetical protein